MNGSDENEQTATNIFHLNFLGSFADLRYTYMEWKEREIEREIRSEKDRERYCVDLGYPARKMSVICILCPEINAFDNNVKSMPFRPKCFRN